MYEIDKILLVRRGVFLVRFLQMQDKQLVEKTGVYHFDNKPMIVKNGIQSWTCTQTP